MNKSQFVFKCRKCGHNLFTEATAAGVKKLINYDCPNCGEEAGDYWNGLWVLLRTGNYEKEFGGDKE